MKILRQIRDIALRELGIIYRNRIYGFCMVVFPLLSAFFFTSLLDEGLPQDMPVGVVDLDNSATSRALTRKLDAFQNSRVVAHFNNFNEARDAVQRGEVYAFLYIPEDMSEKLLASRQPTISFYYTMTSMMGGSLAMKDLKTISALGSAAVGMSVMTAKGLPAKQVQTLMQPIIVDTHQIANPEGSYNVYLSTAMVPGIMMLFMMLLAAYSLGMELKFDTGKEWLARADGNIVVAIIGKFVVHVLVFLAVVLLFQAYIYGSLHFPRLGGVEDIVLLCFLQVLASVGFGIFAFGLMPSLRMSMSISSLWAVLSISMAGSAFPVMGMDAPLQALSWLFPLRHYFMIYQITVFNGFPLTDAWFHLVALVGFTLLPWFVVKKIKNAMLTYVYIP